MILGFYPNENPKFGRFLEEIVDDLGKSSFRIVEEINEEFQIELQLKNERSHNETIEVHCVAGQHYDFKELFFTMKLFFKHPIGNWERLVSNYI